MPLSTLTLRALSADGANTKGARLTSQELDSNFLLTGFFTASGTRPTSGSVAAELFDLHVNVKSVPYSATGDGTTDDTTAIQAAIDACAAAGGGIVFFPEGVYVASGLTVSSDQVALVGTTTRGSRIRFINTTGTLLTVTGALFRFEHFEIESPAATHTAGSIIDVQGSQGKVSHIRITGNFWNCFKLETDGKGGWFFDQIRVTGSNTINSLFRVKGTSGTVADNHVFNIFSATTVVYVEAAVILDTWTDTFRMTGGTLGGTGAPLFLIRDSGTSQDPRYIHVVNVFLENASFDADLVKIDAGDDIRFTGACYFGLGINSVVINAGRDIVFKDNHFIHPQRCGVDYNGGTRVSIEGNTFLDCSTETDVTYSSIDIAANVSEWRVKGNTFRTRTGSAPLPLRQLTIAAGTSTKFSYGDNDWGVAGTDFGAAGAAAVLDGSTGTNVIIDDSVQTLLYRGGAAISHTGTTDATAVISVTLPAGALRTRDGVRIHAAGTTTGTAGTKDISLTFGGSVVSSIQVGAGDTDTWELIATVYNANAVSGANSQMFIGHATRTAADTEGGAHRLKSAGLGIDTTAAVTITVVADLANTADSIVVRVAEIEVLRR